MLLELAVYAGIGTLSGFFAGLLGIGGGVMLTPVLVVAYAGQGFDPAVLVQMAIATTMAIMCMGAAGGALTHARAGAIDWSIGALLVPAVAAGAFLGAQAAPSLPGEGILAVLLAFLLWQAFSVLRPQRPNVPAGPGKRVRLAAGWVIALGAVIGAAGAVIGIGGGIILVPLLVQAGLRIKRAIGTSSFNTFWLSFAGAGGYLLPLNSVADLVPELTVGLVYLPALGAAGAAALIGAVGGARLAHVLPGAVLRKVFSVLLVLIALRLMWFLAEGEGATHTAMLPGAGGL